MLVFASTRRRMDGEIFIAFGSLPEKSANRQSVNVDRSDDHIYHEDVSPAPYKLLL